MNVVLYSSYERMGKIIENAGYQLLDRFEQYRSLELFLNDTIEKIDILYFIGSNFNKDVEFLLKIAYSFPEIKIKYIISSIDLDDRIVLDKLCQLIDREVYDIYINNQLTSKDIINILKHNKTRTDNIYFLRKRDEWRETDVQIDEEEFVIEDIKEEIVEDVIDGVIGKGYDNVIAVSSVKPGSGKSFLSTNLAVGIARFGKKRYDGNPPRVALIDGDLQTLAVGTLLKMNNEKFNLKNALDAIKHVIDEDGNDIGSKELHQNVQDFILKCFLPYAGTSNLYVLSSSQTSFEEWKDVSPYHFFYLIESIVEEFDVIIIDSNSALEHRTTAPILQLANVCFYVIDLEYNNVRMNQRYQQTLSEIGADKKIKYVLNKDITNKLHLYAEKLEYDKKSLMKDFTIIGAIPEIDMSIIINRLAKGVPIILDDTKETLDARMEITNIADKVWDMGNIFTLRLEKEMHEKKTGLAKKIIG